MSKKEKKTLKKWRLEWKQRRKFAALDLARARGRLAVQDDGGVEKAIRKVWNWADAKLAQQDPQAVTVIGGLHRMEGLMSESLDTAATLFNTSLERFPEPSTPAPAARTSRTAALSESDIEFLKRRPDALPVFLATALSRRDVEFLKSDPLALRGFLGESARSAGSSAGNTAATGLTQEERRIAAQLGITDEKRLEELAKGWRARAPARAADDTLKVLQRLAKTDDSPTLTEWQIKAARRMGITDVDPEKVRETADAMRSGAGVVIESPKSRAA